jgi:glutamate/tyrosine decarboxylase-like PLP-dependent enzyme
MVVATAGTTVLGAFDPIAEIANVCEHRKVWLHVDAAWGGPALFSKACRSLVEGIERADSVCFDAHKLFGANLTCAFFLTRHSGLLLDANDVAGGDYLFHADKSRTDLGRLSWQCGRRPDAFTFWALWKSHGTAGLGEFVDRLIQIRTECVDWILVQDRLELVSSPSFLNICVRVTAPSGQADWSLRVREALIEQNLAMVNYSQNADGPFLRLILAHPYLETQNVTQILEWALALR